MIAALLLPCILAGTAAAADAPEAARADFDCEALLAPGDPRLTPGAADIARVIAARRAPRVAAGDVDDDLRLAVEHLSNERRLAPILRRDPLADEALARFAPIFLKYACAELRARGFDDQGISYYLTTARVAFSLESRVEFARAVALRMLVTVNDEPSARGPAGLTQFREATRAFGLDEATYAEFLEVWRCVRGAFAPTIVHFVMANIDRAADALARDRDARLARKVRRPRWVDDFVYTFFNRVRPPRPGPIEIERELARELAPPAFVSDVRALDERTHSRLDRFIGRATESLDALDLCPPFARAYVFRNLCRNLGPGDLVAARTRPEYALLDDVERARVEDDRRVFARLDELRRALLARERARPPAVNQLATEFAELFGAEFADVPRAYRNPKAAVKAAEAVDAAFVKLRQRHPRLSTAMFIACASRAIDVVASTDIQLTTTSVLRTLSILSREFAMTHAQRRVILDLIGTYRFSVTDGFENLSYWKEARGVLAEEAWGEPDAASPTEVASEPAPGPGDEDLLGEVRELLGDEVAALGPDELRKRVLGTP